MLLLTAASCHSACMLALLLQHTFQKDQKQVCPYSLQCAWYGGGLQALLLFTQKLALCAGSLACEEGTP